MRLTDHGDLRASRSEQDPESEADFNEQMRKVKEAMLKELKIKEDEKAAEDYREKD